MTLKKQSAYIISTFNTENFISYLRNDSEHPEINISPSPFGSAVSSALTDDSLINEKEKCDFFIIWTQAEKIISSFNKLINNSQTPVNTILSEVDDFCSKIILFAEKVKTVFIPSWVLPSYYRGYGFMDMKNELGITNILMRMNLRMCDNFQQYSNIFILNTSRWIELAGKNAFNPKLWYMGKIAFGNDVFKEAVRDIKAAINAIYGNNRKLIILDLDDTLWGGIVGDDGWENLILGGHDPIGEAFADFQHTLKSLKQRGIILAIVSKNTEAVALEAISKNSEMILKIDDFAAWRINWNDKAENILSLLEELNLGAQSAVFIDDNPAERFHVKNSIPDIFVPELPEDKMLYAKTLQSLTCFDSLVVTDEDRLKTVMYKFDKEREKIKTNFQSSNDWIKSLEIKVLAEELKKENIIRTVQLLNKTNQMNLSTRRLTEQELTDWCNKKENKLWTFRVLDKFGDSGLIGIISISIKNKSAQIIDFVLSCRVFGKNIEEVMLYMAVSHAAKLNLENITAQYISTEKNKPSFDFWKEKSGFIYNKEDNTFKFSTKTKYPKPESIELIYNED
jgi:FkbH-like protein